MRRGVPVGWCALGLVLIVCQAVALVDARRQADQLRFEVDRRGEVLATVTREARRLKVDVVWAKRIVMAMLWHAEQAALERQVQESH